MSNSAHIYKFRSEFIQRYKNFLTSDAFKSHSDFSKSEYWDYYSKKIKVEIKDDQIITFGESGYYAPNSSSKVARILEKLKKPSELKKSVLNKLNPAQGILRLPNYFEAFDLVMSEHELSDPRRSRSNINFKEMQKKPVVLKTTDDLISRYFAKKKYSVSNLVIEAAYFFNILSAYSELDKSRIVMEIGAGNGNVLSFLKNYYPNLTLVCIDLPETLSHSIPFLCDLFPQAKVCLPHEEIVGNLIDYDFVFLTTTQTSKIPSNIVDLSINTSSFQEMLPKQIEEYFLLIERVSKTNGLFFTSNRVEKTPVADLVEFRDKDEPTIRFSDFPWNPKNETLIYEICRLSRLVQLDDCYLRMEKILK